MQNYALGFEEIKTESEKLEAEPTPVAADSPVKLQYNEDGTLKKVTYADEDAREQGQPFLNWSEELIRDASGKVTGVKTVRPSGSTVTEQFLYDENNKFIGTKLIREDEDSGGDSGGGEIIIDPDTGGDSGGDWSWE